MADVIADPDKLRSLATSITKSADQLDQIARQLQRSVANAGWKDSEGQKFEENLKAATKSLTQLSKQLKSEQVPVLKKKAEALDRFRS